jgi:hypothetical protein
VLNGSAGSLIVLELELIIQHMLTHLT